VSSKSIIIIVTEQINLLTINYLLS